MTHEKTQKIILFDGVCNFCNSSVNFIIKRDPNAKLTFATLQSEAGKRLLNEYSLANNVDSIIYIEGEKTFDKSDAALRVARQLNGLWPVLSVLRLLPKVLRDWCYSAFGKRRYQLFGKSDVCMVATEEVRQRFL